MSLNARNMALYAGGAVLAGLVAWSFALTGSPETQRKLSDDRDMAYKIECLACHATTLACESATKQYPDKKEALIEKYKDNQYCYHDDQLSCRTYSYYGERNPNADFSSIRYSLENNKIKLCGTFNFSEAEQRRLEENDDLPREMRDYKQGEQCFTFEPRKCPNK